MLAYASVRVWQTAAKLWHNSVCIAINFCSSQTILTKMNNPLLALHPFLLRPVLPVDWYQQNSSINDYLQSSLSCCTMLNIKIHLCLK